MSLSPRARPVVRTTAGAVPTRAPGRTFDRVPDLPDPPAPTPRPAPQAVRAALRRARAGEEVAHADAAVLLAASGEELDALLALAADRRDAHLDAEGRAGLVTYSP